MLFGICGSVFSHSSVRVWSREALRTPAAPAAAAVPRKLLLVMGDFFMMVMVGCSKIMFLSEGLKVSCLKV